MLHDLFVKTLGRYAQMSPAPGDISKLEVDEFDILFLYQSADII